MTHRLPPRIAWDYGDDDGFFGLWRLGAPQPIGSIQRIDAEGTLWLGLVLTPDSGDGGYAAVKRTPAAACRWVEEQYSRLHRDARQAIADARTDRVGVRAWPTADEVAANGVTTKTPNK